MSDYDAKTSSPQGFVDRWSARKRKHASTVERTVERTVESEPPIITSPEVGRPVSEHEPTKVAESSIDPGHERTPQHPNIDADAANNTEEDALAPLLSDEDMPAITTLTAKSDLSDFFNKGVSADLRRAALRYVFQLPVYNERDGLNDYDDDFTQFEPLGDTITSDMKWHKERKERELQEAEAQQRLRDEEENAQQELEKQEQEEIDEQRADDQEELSDESIDALEKDAHDEPSGVEDANNEADPTRPETELENKLEALDVESTLEGEGTPT